MENEQTNKSDTSGTKTNKDNENNDKPISEYDKTLALVKRREEASKVELEILNRKEKLASENLLSGTSGGHVDAPVVSPEDVKTNQAKEFFKDTALGDAISKVSEKKQ